MLFPQEPYDKRRSTRHLDSKKCWTKKSPPIFIGGLVINPPKGEWILYRFTF